MLVMEKSYGVRTILAMTFRSLRPTLHEVSYQ